MFNVIYIDLHVHVDLYRLDMQLNVNRAVFLIAEKIAILQPLSLKN